MPIFYCWKCAKTIEQAQTGIGFRSACPHCSSDLHVCVNCRYYALGKPNDCLVPNTESIRDREKANFCEEFKLRSFSSNSSSPKQSNKFLGEPEPKKDFNSLFKD